MGRRSMVESSKLSAARAELKGARAKMRSLEKEVAVLRRLAMTDNELESALSALPPASGQCSHARELSARARRRSPRALTQSLCSAQRRSGAGACA